MTVPFNPRLKSCQNYRNFQEKNPLSNDKNIDEKISGKYIIEFRTGSFKNPKETDPESEVLEIKEHLILLYHLWIKEQYQKKGDTEELWLLILKTMMDIIFVLCLV